VPSLAVAVAFHFLVIIARVVITRMLSDPCRVEVGSPNKINESLMKIIEKSLKTAKIDRKIAESGWI
jgi:hypothetical protein